MQFLIKFLLAMSTDYVFVLSVMDIATSKHLCNELFDKIKAILICLLAKISNHVLLVVLGSATYCSLDQNCKGLSYPPFRLTIGVAWWSAQPCNTNLYA